MNALFNILRKGLLLTVLVIFGFVAVYVPQPHNQIKNVEALIVFDPANTVQGTISAVADTADLARKNVLNPIAWAIAKRIVAEIMQSTISWVNSGFKGSPAFIQNFGRFMLDVADRTAGDVIQSFGGAASFLCSPFRLDIQIALSLRYQQQRKLLPFQQCRLTGIFKNFEQFIEGDFKQGGWKGWFQLTAKPEAYTPFGQLLAADGVLRARLTNARGEELNLAGWGSGFLSSKVCTPIDSPSGSAPGAGSATSTGSGGVNPKETCVVTTPGTAIAGSLNKALGSGVDGLIQADQINELIGALMGQLASKALTGAAGLLGLSSGTGQTYAGFDGGSFLNQATVEASGLIDTEDAAQVITDAITVQTDYLLLAETYGPQLTAYQFNPQANPDNIEASIQASFDSADIEDEARANIQTLTPLLNQARQLDTEFNNPATTPERKNDIQQQQSNLLNNFYSLRIYSRDAVRASETLWKSILR
jgi:hypothetical protein